MTMMKKIKNIKQLKAEKKQLMQRRDELEKAIKYDWRDVKESLKPKNVSNQVLSKLFDGKDKEDSFAAEGISQVAASFTKKIVGKAENKIGKWFKK
jgi:cell division septum initiation protein DivIVA